MENKYCHEIEENIVIAIRKFLVFRNENIF